MMREEIEAILQEALCELNEQMEEEEKLTYSPDMRLIGSKAAMDSMTFVTLITIIEELVADKLNKDVTIVSNKAFSQERSPFYSMKTLGDFVAELAEEA